MPSILENFLCCVICYLGDADLEMTCLMDLVGIDSAVTWGDMVNNTKCFIM